MTLNADKRTVATDALETLGTIIDETAGRDAIHLAVEPVIAAHILRPGDHIGLLGDGKAGHGATCVGIVDPFIGRNVQPGERFWLVVYPRQITSLRHVWTHPAFEGAAEPAPAADASVVASRKWIEDFSANIPLSYEVLMGGARDWVASRRRGSWGEYLNFGDLLESKYVPDEFWEHYERVAGEKVEDDHRGSFFSCSC